MHSKQNVLLALLVNLPAGQSSHDSFFALAPNEPGRHAFGAAEPTGHEVPSGQIMQSSSRLLKKPVRLRTVWLACVPPGHGCGALEPSTQR